MSLSYIDIGTIVYSATGAASVAPAPPAHNAGDLLMMAIGIHTSGTKTVTIPANWAEVPNAEAAGGGGTFGADAGPSRAKLLYQIAPDTSTAAVTVTLPGTEVGSVAYGVIAVWRSTSGAYAVAGANGIDSTTGTPFEAAMGADPGLIAGDHVLIAGSIPTDVSTPTQFSAPTLIATGITTTVTELGEPDSNAGNDIGGVICRATIDTGPATGVATFSTTAGGTTTNVRGPIVAARIREFAINAATHAPAADNLALTQVHQLAVANATHAPVATTVALVVDLAVAAAVHAPVADNVVLQVSAGTDLVIAGATHAPAVDNLVLTQVHALVVGGATHSATAANVTLTQVHNLTVGAAVHAPTAATLALTQIHSLVLADAIHGPSAANVVLSVVTPLVVADAVHAATVAGLVLTQAHNLAVAAATHAPVAEQMILTQIHELVPASAAQAQLAAEVVLTLPVGAGLMHGPLPVLVGAAVQPGAVGLLGGVT